jgi:hypothetical protein
MGSLASIQSASAQSATPLVVADIPFAFQTANQTLPAGRYHIVRESDHMIRLYGPGKTGGLMSTTSTSRLDAPDHASVIFDHTGDTYFLRQIWRAGDKSGVECPNSRADQLKLQADNQPPDSTEAASDSAPKR